MANQHQLLLKKDAEKFNNADMGLANTVHKIVKGDIQRVEGNRVYLQVNQKEIREDELYKLIAYLDKKIAEPNNLYFDEFQYDDGQLSFRVSRFDAPKIQGQHEKEKRVDSASGVAQAVCKRNAYFQRAHFFFRQTPKGYPNLGRCRSRRNGHWEWRRTFFP